MLSKLKRLKENLNIQNLLINYKVKLNFINKQIRVKLKKILNQVKKQKKK